MTASLEAAEQLDTAIDALLRDEASSREVGATAELAATARLLRDVLPRFHPRFGFAELLATRIAALGRDRASGRDRSVAGTTVEPIPFPVSPPASPAVTESDGSSRVRRRSLVAGGAIASGVSIAIPLAGAALMMWRRGRSHGGLL